MTRIFLISYLIILTFSSVLLAQTKENKFGFSLNINYTTTSEFFLHPNSTDAVIRNIHEDLEDIRSYSAELRYFLSESILIGIGTEYIEKTSDNVNLNLGGFRLVMTDGYKMIPLELSLYYQLPFSTESFKFFMGGGMGIYFGWNIRAVGDVSIKNISRKIGYGIHVSVGMDYVVKKFLSLRGQMRFRDPEFEMESEYSSDIVNYEGRALLFQSQTFASKVNIDGITFSLGAVFNFSL